MWMVAIRFLKLPVNPCKNSLIFKCQPHKVVKHTQTIRRQITDELFVFDHFVGLTLKGLNYLSQLRSMLSTRVCSRILFLGLSEFELIQSRSIARVWNTHFIIFSFRARDSFPAGIFRRQLTIHYSEYHNIMGTRCEH